MTPEQREKRNAKLREYYAKNRDKYKAKVRAYVKANPEKVRAFRKKYAEENRGAIAEKHRRYVQKNREKIRARLRAYHKRKRIESPAFRLEHNMRNRLNLAIRGRIKTGSTWTLIGCDPATLRSHLESMFRDGMTWDNYGQRGWHVDHIIPCASFNLESPEDQRRCFNYKNLQPLWAHENMRKSWKVA